MPVELPPQIDDASEPSPPGPVLWGILVTLIIVGGVLLMLITWPKNAPTNTAWFWTRTALFPVVAGMIAYGLRLLYWEQEMDRREAERVTRRVECDEAMQFAREPLAILEYRYLCAIGDMGAATAIVGRQRALEARRSSSGQVATRHTCLTSIKGTCADRYRSCLVKLLEQIETTLESIPREVPFAVHLNVSADLERSEIEEIWRQCWESAGYESAGVKLSRLDRDLMGLDAWLDVQGGPSLERFALVIAIQLRGAPIENSAEAAVALLVGWAPLVERSGLNFGAVLHRPVEAVDDTAAAISSALVWAELEPAAISDVWQAGISGPDRSAVLQATSDLSMAVSESENFSGIHDIDAAIGDAGIAAGWLAVVLAAEHAVETNVAQLTASRQGSLKFAVIRPNHKREATRIQE